MRDAEEQYLDEQDLDWETIVEWTSQVSPEPISVVYFVRCVVTGAIKIGFSEDILARFRDLQSGAPEPLELVHTISGGIQEERRLHRLFASERMHGEWFRAGGMCERLMRDLSAGLTGELVPGYLLTHPC